VGEKMAELGRYVLTGLMCLVPSWRQARLVEILNRAIQMHAGPIGPVENSISPLFRKQLGKIISSLGLDRHFAIRDVGMIPHSIVPANVRFTLRKFKLPGKQLSRWERDFEGLQNMLKQTWVLTEMAAREEGQEIPRHVGKIVKDLVELDLDKDPRRGAPNSYRAAKAGSENKGDIPSRTLAKEISKKGEQGIQRVKMEEELTKMQREMDQDHKSTMGESIQTTDDKKKVEVPKNGEGAVTKEILKKEEVKKEQEAKKSTAEQSTGSSRSRRQKGRRTKRFDVTYIR